MTEIIFIVEEAPEGGYTARAVGEAIFTEADTLPALQDMVRDAVVCHFDEGDAPAFADARDMTKVFTGIRQFLQ
mgnify:CR=1 FL=1